MMGWLVGDIVLGAYIPKSDAFAVGRKVGKLAPSLKAEFDAPSRRVGKRKWESEEARSRADEEASAEEAALRCEPVKLPLPAAVSPVPLQRKRVQMPEPKPKPDPREPEPEYVREPAPMPGQTIDTWLFRRAVTRAQQGVTRALTAQVIANSELARAAAAAEWLRGVVEQARIAHARACRELEKHGPMEDAGWVHDHHCCGDWELNREGHEREVQRRLGVQQARLHARYAVEDAERAVRWHEAELRDEERYVLEPATIAAEEARRHVQDEQTELKLAQHELSTGLFRSEWSCEQCASVKCE